MNNGILKQLNILATGSTEKIMDMLAAFEIGDPIEAKDGQSPKNRRFSMTGYTGRPMRLGGWYSPVIVALDGLAIPSSSLPIYVNHQADIENLLGQASDISVKNGKLVAEGEVMGESDTVKKVLALTDKGFKWQASIGARADQVEYIPEGKSVKVNGKSYNGPLNVAWKATLGEISFVALGADTKTSAKIAAGTYFDQQFMKGNKMTKAQLIEKIMANAKNTQTAEQLEAMDVDALKKILASFDANDIEAKADAQSGTPVKAAAVTDDPVEKMNAAVAANLDRIAGINEKCKDHPKIAAQAIKENWSVDKAELAAMRASAPVAPGIIVSGTETGINILEAAALMAGGVRGDDLLAVHGEKTVEAASKQFKGRIGLQQLLLEAAWLNGYTGRHFSNSEMGSILRAAFSTFSLPGILSNIANKFLLDAFMHIESTWRKIAAVRNVKDFKQVTSYRMTGGLKFEKVGPDGELKHGTLGEDSYTNQADTHGILFAITRTDLINDDLGALTSVPKLIGRGAALQLNLVFWTEFLNNAAFFTAARGNYAEGAATALGIDALTAAELLFLDQKDSKNNPLGIVPSILLVPNAENVNATNLMKSLELRDTTANKKTPVSNPHAGKFSVERSAYLSNAAIAGNSTKAWYLLADPNDEAAIEIAFLNGIEQPTVEQADANFNTLGIQMRGFFDFGVSKREYRGGVKMKGEV